VLVANRVGHETEAPADPGRRVTSLDHHVGHHGSHDDKDHDHGKHRDRKPHH